MKQVSLDYTEDFSCLAGSCPDTCCKDWEIILDEDAISRYQKMPGVLGEQVRAAMTQTDCLLYTSSAPHPSSISPIFSSSCSTRSCASMRTAPFPIIVPRIAILSDTT